MSVAANTSVPSPQDLIAQLTQKLSEAESRLGETQNRLHYAELKIQVLEARLRLVRLAKYGPGSEKLCDAQLELLELEPGVSVPEVQAESQRPSLPQAKGRNHRKHPGRQPLPPHLRRVEVLVACREEQRVCPQCGDERVVIGHEQSEQLDVEPAQYFVQVTKREKRACRHCEEQGVVTAATQVVIRAGRAVQVALLL